MTYLISHSLFIKAWILAGMFLLVPGCGQRSSEMDPPAEAFPAEEVILLESPFKVARDRAVKTLLEVYEPDRFLAWIRPMAGLTPKAEKYMGWETWLTTHSLGHYLSGCSLAWSQTSNPEFISRTDYMVEELALIQETSGCGYIAKPSDRAEFENKISSGDISSIGFRLNEMRVPLYTFHKLLSGLRDVYRLTGNKTALEVEIRFADWIYDQIYHLTEEQFQKIRDCEHGGISESLADLYHDTRDLRYLELSRRFYDPELMDPIYKGRDALTGLHANTQIPKYTGLARIFELTGADREKITAVNFWNMVTRDHSYATGGNSFHEHFGPPGKLNDYLDPVVTETCNTYNMLKLSKHVFCWQPDSEIADYMERAIFNHSLASIHPQNGRVTYHLSLDMPARRSFNHPHSFSCCVGSGMEHHFLYAGLIYFHTRDALYVNQFIPSELNWQEKGIRIRQETDFPFSNRSVLIVHAQKKARFSLRIRKPAWAEGAVVFSVNGQKVQAEEGKNGYYLLDRRWKEGDSIVISLPLKLQTESMPDNEDRIAIFYGPLLLGGDLGALNETSPDEPDFVPVLLTKDRKPEEWVKAEDLSQGSFHTLHAGDPRDVTLKPFFQLYDRYHSIYWDVFEPRQWEAEKKMYLAGIAGFKEAEKNTIDLFQPGEMQAERDHAFRGENTQVLEFEGIKGRVARSGWFAFELDVLADTPMVLQLKYRGAIGGNYKASFDVLVEGQIITTQIIQWSGDFFKVDHMLPEELTRGKEKVTVMLRAEEKFQAGPLCGARMIRPAID